VVFLSHGHKKGLKNVSRFGFSVFVSVVDLFWFPNYFFLWLGEIYIFFYMFRVLQEVRPVCLFTRLSKFALNVKDLCTLPVQLKRLFNCISTNLINQSITYEIYQIN